jgi:DNA gyrase/topoisomerase IV subunit A
VLTRNGIVLRTRLDEIRQTGRKALGVRLMHLAHDDEIVGIAIMEGTGDFGEADLGADAEPPLEANGAAHS